MNNENTGGVRCHDADACAMGQLPCPTPWACGCATGAVQVLIDFDQIGTAGPFQVVNGRVRLPAETMMDMARMLKPTIDAMAAAPQECTRSHPHEEMTPMCELRTEIARLTNALARAEAAAPQAVQAAVLAHLDGLLDDAAAHIYPSDLRKCQTSECTVTVASVRMGNREERSVPLFSREQVVEAFEAALAAQAKQRGA